MSELRIPDSQKDAFDMIADSDAVQLAAIQSALRSLSTTRYLRSSTELLAESTHLSVDEARELLLMVSGIFSLQEEPSIDSSTLIEDLLAAAEADDELTMSGERLDRLAGFLKEVFTLDDTLGVSSKAWSVAWDSERTYCFSRMLTDLRPVFKSNSEETAVFVLVHNLKIAFHEGSETKEFFVSLTAKDLQKLLKVLQRAERKERSLIAAMEDSKIPILSAE